MDRLSERLVQILEESGRVNIHDRKEGFTDSSGRYFGRYTLEVAPYGKNERRYEGDDIVVLITQASEHV